MPNLHDLLVLLLTPAFTLWGSATTWAEIIGFVLAVWMVIGNIRERLWAWPLAIISSLLYFALFWRSKLYGDAALQIFFVLLALWGWLQWWRGLGGDATPQRVALPVTTLNRNRAIKVIASCVILWGVTGLFLQHYTDTDVPWWDAFPTAVSLVAQYLLARKYLENWAAWLVVNTVSIGLFAYKGLWLTVILYALFIAMSVAGWRAWRQRLCASLPS
jgi:nicotinamide mononucleotide transporter